VREARLRQAYLAANVHDRIAAVPVMQSAAQAPRERRRLARQIDRLTEAMVLRARAQAHHRWWLDLALSGLALSVLVVWSLGALARGEWSSAFEGVGLLVGALGLIGLLAMPLRRIGRALEQRVAAEVARDRIADFLADAEPAPPPTSASLPQQPLLRLAAVPLPQRPLHPLAAQVAPGQCIALVGPPGSGKTALLETLARLRPLTAGEIELGDQPLGAIGLREFSERVSYVSADTPVQRGTVARNLRYRRRHDTEEELRAAAEAAGWPGPLDEAQLSLRVRDGGSNLGGRQRRALLLASALAGRPALLLADDLEHLLDGADLEAAFRRLRSTHRGTLIFSTHDARLAALADDRWLLGEPAAAGPTPLRLVSGGGA
jgi:ABC-type multidrug transport system fused ATPase/permease subunit